jgi:flagellar biogenesis protein FliO
MRTLRSDTRWLTRSSFGERLRALWDRLRHISSRTPKRLRLAESLGLGDRRFVAVVEFEEERFLVGGTASSLVLLARLGAVPQPEEQEQEEEKEEEKGQTPLNALWSGGGAARSSGSKPW